MDGIVIGLLAIIGLLVCGVLALALYLAIEGPVGGLRYDPEEKPAPEQKPEPEPKPFAASRNFTSSHGITTTDEVKGVDLNSERSVVKFSDALGRISKTRDSFTVKSNNFAAESTSAGPAEAMWIKTAEADPLIEADYLVSGDPYAVIYGEYGRLGTPRNGVFGPAPRLNVASGYN